MQNFFKRSIKNYLRLILIVAILDLSAISFFSYTQIKGIFTTAQYSRTLADFEVDFDLMHQSQQDFMLKYKENPDFFKTGENEYIDNFNQSLSSGLDELSKLKKNKITQKLDLSIHLDNVKEGLLRYRNIFDEYTIKIKQYGNEDFGITTKLKKAISNLIKLNIDPQLNELLLIIQQQENQYTENPLISNYNKLRDTFRQLTSLLDILPINNNTKTLITTNLADYSNYLNLIKQINQEIGIDYDHGLRGELGRQSERINPTVQLIKTDINTLKIKFYNDSILITLIVLVISLLVTFISVQFLSKRIHNFLGNLQKWIQQLSKGEIPDDIEKIDDIDEISSINNDLFVLTSDLRSKTEFAERIGAGDYSVNYKISGAKDTLGLALIEMRDNLNMAKQEEVKRNKEAEQRKWTNEGLNKFSDLLRDKFEDIETFNYQIISELTRYVKGSQGAIFIFNVPDKKNTEKYLELKAAFAYDRRKFIDKKILPGEGLVGTAAIEGETIYLKELPADYVVIGSGLGEAEPNTLLIAPLKMNNEVFGVVEIASFTSFEDFHIAFIEKVGEIIASTIQSIKVRESTNTLLEQSRRQADEMQAQEEEMRQNLEELQATQEERARREAEISGILEAIDASMLMLELNAQGLISEVNEKFLRLVQLEYSDLRNRNYFETIEPFRSTEEINKFWENIRLGQMIDEVIQIQTKNGYAWLNISYTPIFDNNEDLNKVLLLAIDVTQTQKQKEELLEQAEEMTAQEEEMLQNFEALHTAQDEMSKKQKELEEANLRLKANEDILRKALNSAKKKEEQFKNSQTNLETKIKELINTQLELKSTEQENLAQLAAINKTSIMLEMDNKGKILFPNENFCRELKFSPTELIGKSHAILISAKMQASKEYQGLWSYLNEGNIQTGQCILIAKDKTPIPIFGTYVPVKNENETVNKILFIGTKIIEKSETEETEKLRTKEKQLLEKNKLLEIMLKSTKDNYIKQIKLLEAEINKLKKNK